MSIIRSFIVNRTKLALTSSIIVLLLSIIFIFHTNVIFFVGLLFATSLISIFRIITFKTGKIPFFVSDKLWDVLRLKYKDPEEADKKYKERSLKTAVIFYLLMIVSLSMYLIAEFIVYIFLT